MKNKRNFNWSSGLFIIGYHLLMFALVPLYCLLYGAPSTTLVLSTVGLLFITGVSITAGYHRLFSHTTYKTNRTIEAILLFFGSMATQGSALRWSYDHRLHHAHIDKEEDPYSVTRGFWHAHVLWMFKKQPPIEKKVVSDLYRNKLILFQHKYFEILMVVTNIIATLFFGWITGNYFGAFVFTWLVRLFFLHHFTWFINSLAHYWGHQNYSTEHSAVDNYIICLLTFGEGYHNYHHTFANDYRNGIRWYHFDPSKWLIWTLSKLGLAHGLKKANEARISIAMIHEHKKALLDKIKDSLVSKKEEIEQKVNQYSDTLLEKLDILNQLANKYRAAKKTSIDGVSQTLIQIGREISSLKKSLKKDWRIWRRFSKKVMRLKEVA